jgi:hypothetical protein
MPSTVFLSAITNYQIIDGEHSGEEIYIKNCVELPEEPTYSLAEYTEIHQEALKWREEVKELLLANETFAQEHVASKNVILNLTNEVEEALEAKKVPLPREVAEAIERLRLADAEWGIENNNFSILDVVNQSLRGKVYSTDGSIIAAWIGKIREKRERLVTALVNGFTVELEPTPKQKAIQHLIKGDMVARGHSAHDVVTEIMSILGTEQSG